MRREVISNPDISQLINSDAIQRVLNSKKVNRAQHPRLKRNPLKNRRLMRELNPYCESIKEERANECKKRIKKTVNKEKSRKLLKAIQDKILIENQNEDREYKEIIKSTTINK